MFNNGLNTYNDNKSKTIDLIMANKKCTFTKEQLEVKELDELKSLASLAVNEEAPQPIQQQAYNFAGQIEGAGVTNNDKEEPLDVPSMNFGPEEKVA